MTKSRMVHQTKATRDKILTAAEQMFVQGGFADTQMKDIASAIGMSRNTLYRYYHDKFDLGFAILVNALKRQVITTNQHLVEIQERGYNSSLDGIQELFLKLCDSSTQLDARFLAEFDAYYSGDRIPAHFRKALSEALSEGLSERVFDKIISTGQEQGEIRKDLSPHQISVLLLNTIPIFHRRMLMRQHALVEIEPEAIPQLTPALIQILIDGLRPVSQSKEGSK